MPRFTTRPEIKGTFGVVATTHWLASAAGMAVLEKGGNAFDAAVATGFSLQIVEPHLNGPAGDVPVIVAPVDGPVKVLCGQGVAPAKATIKAYTDLGLDMVPGTGLLATVVPGAFDTWMTLLRDHGTLRLRDVLEYALAYARDGYALVPNISNAIMDVREMFETEWPSSAEIYLKDGQVPEPGTLFTNPVLAETYERIIREAEASGSDRESEIEAARKIWSEGFIAQTIDAFCRENEFMDSSGERHSGLLRGSDMAAWQASWEDPVQYDYHGHTIYKTGPWGQGPVFLQQLALLNQFDLSGMDENDPEFVHLVTEASKLAFADREAFYADPKFVDVPVETLLSDEYNQARAKLITDSASMEIRPGSIPGYGGKVQINIRDENAAAGSGAGEPTVARYEHLPTNKQGIQTGDTCHFDIIDKWGNMVSGTPSGGWLQSSPAIPGLGFALNTRAQMFWLEEGLPASLAPGKRPRSTLSVSFCKKQGAPYMMFGTPGGDQQDQWAVHFLLRHIHFGLNLQESIDAPGFHSTHFPGSFYPRECDPGRITVEGRFPPATIEELKRRGHKLIVDDDWSIGRVSAASKQGKLLKAAANPRFMQGYAIGR